MRLMRVALVSALLAAMGCTALLGDFTLGAAVGGGDGGGVEPGDGSNGTNDAGDGGAPEAAAGTIRCDFITKVQRTLNDNSAPLSVERIDVLPTSQSSTIAVVKTTSTESVAYEFRSDRPDEAPGFAQLGGKLLASGRSYDGTGTYVLAWSDAQRAALLHMWKDGSGLGGTPLTSAFPGSVQAGTFTATPQGMFYALAIDNIDPSFAAGQGTFINVLDKVGPPTFTNNQVSSTVDTGLQDGQRLYRLADGSVMLLAHFPDLQLHQLQYRAGSTATGASRVLASEIFPFTFSRNGTNVDIAMALPDANKTSFSLYMGVVPESSLFQFQVPGDLKPVSGVPLGGASSKPCGVAYAGQMMLLLPAQAGFDLVQFDVASATPKYSLLGASNLLHSNTAILDCAMGAPRIQGSTTTFDVVWTERLPGGGQNLVYAPLQCVTQ